MTNENLKLTDDLLSLEEVSKFLKLSKTTLYIKTSQRKIPFCKMPGSNRIWFSRSELSNWILSNKKQ
jgi:excisionase family DNA binding protein